MGGRTNEQIKEIEQTQEALRESINQAKELAERAQTLLQKHKKTVEDQDAPEKDRDVSTE